MKMTASMKSWLVANSELTDAAPEDELKKAASESLVDGTLTAEKFSELQREPENDSAKKAVAGIVAEVLGEALGPIADAIKSQSEAIAQIKQEQRSQPAVEEVADEIANMAAQVTRGVGEAAQQAVAVPQKAAGADISELTRDPGTSPGSHKSVNYLGAERQYDSTKSTLRYQKGHVGGEGNRAYFGDRALDDQSELDKAITGAWFKYALWTGGGKQSGNCPRSLVPNEHDMQLVKYALHEEPFTGVLGGQGTEENGCAKVDNRKLMPHEVKALLDDGGASGATEIAPIVFDNAIITTPVLFGELFPLVNLINIGSGRRVEGASIGNPTFTSGTAEGTAITLFTTTSFVSAFDTTIFNAVGAMEIGMDFEEDSPVGIGQIIAQKYGEKAMEWLDAQIANGDGTTQPQGVINGTGLSETAWGGDAATVSDYEGFLFGIGKEYRPAGEKARTVFVSNDTSYQRSRSIAVGTADQRRVFGMETNAHGDYAILGHGYKISSSLSNAEIIFGNFAHYRMYRRLGLNVRFESAGQTLALNNTRLIVVRMRYGGQIEDANAFIMTTSALA